MSKEKEILMTFDKEKLSDLIIYLMERLEEKEKIQFISKYINPKLALESVGAEHTSTFLTEVKKFCEDCLNGEFFVEPIYNDYWDSYDEETLVDCYENLNKIPEAFEVAKKLFYNNPSYNYYKKARFLANKII